VPPIEFRPDFVPTREQAHAIRNFSAIEAGCIRHQHQLEEWHARARPQVNHGLHDLVKIRAERRFAFAAQGDML
jgi:hypothetical protein